MQHCFPLFRKSLRFLGSAIGIAIANRQNRCDFGALRSTAKIRVAIARSCCRARKPPKHQKRKLKSNKCHLGPPRKMAPTQRAQRSKKFDLDRNFQSRSKFLISLENSNLNVSISPQKIGPWWWLARKFHSRSKFSISIEISNFFDLWALWESQLKYSKAPFLGGINMSKEQTFWTFSLTLGPFFRGVQTGISLDFQMHF